MGTQIDEIPVMSNADIEIMGKDETISEYIEKLKSASFIMRSIAVDKLITIGELAKPFLEEVANSEISHRAAKESLRRLGSVQTSTCAQESAIGECSCRDKGNLVR